MFAHPLSDIHENTVIGSGTTIWQFVVVMEGAKVGENCNLCAQVLVEGGVTLGDNVTVKSGVYLWSGVTVESNVFIGPNATFTNDRFPRSKKHLQSYPQTLVKQGASIGANATILPGIIIGESAMVGAGAVVTKDVPDFSVVVGNPARVVDEIDKSHR